MSQIREIPDFCDMCECELTPQDGPTRCRECEEMEMYRMETDLTFPPAPKVCGDCYHPVDSSDSCYREDCPHRQ